MKAFISLVFLCTTTFSFFCSNVKAQTKVFSSKDLLYYVNSFHPVAQQNELLTKNAESIALKARGGFDPTLEVTYDHKDFDKKDYYRVLDAGLKIPTWYGVNINAGFEQTEGVFLNPERTTPTSGLFGVGLSVPLGEGLIIDKRRAAVQQAAIFKEATVIEQASMMNELRHEALKSYIKWSQYWHQLKVLEKSIDLAVERLEGVITSFELGDKPAIDTLESYIVVQNRQLTRDQYGILYQNALLELSNYLWSADKTPLELTDVFIPEVVDTTQIYIQSMADTVLNTTISQHPAIRKFEIKLQDLAIQRRLKVEALKPTLDLKANLLQQGFNNTTPDGDLGFQNYTFGATFAMPLVLRKERADIQLADVKINQTQVEQAYKVVQLQNKQMQYQIELERLFNMEDLYVDAVGNYSRLLEGEKIKFELGESSVFLINSRESKYIDAQLKLIEISSKVNKAQLGYIWSLGRL